MTPLKKLIPIRWGPLASPAAGSPPFFFVGFVVTFLYTVIGYRVPTKMKTLERENKILMALLEVSRAMNSSFDLKRNLAHAMHAFRDFLEMERGSVGYKVKKYGIRPDNQVSPV